MTDRIERLERRVRRLTVAVVILAAVVLYVCLPENIATEVRRFVLAAIPVMGFLIVAGLMTLVMIHRQIPAIAREVGRWFAPLR